MTTAASARWLLEQEARALLTRLGRIRPFALQETMVPAAALTPTAQLAIERFLIGGRYAVRNEVLAYLRWLRGPGRNAPPEELQRRFTVVRMRFNATLSQFDVFSELITQRSETENGVWLAGLDVLAGDALTLAGGYFEPPQAVCYLARGPGAAIRRARTRVPGGGSNPVAIVRVPRERMVGHGIASSLVHECGHQAAALLDLVPSLRTLVHARALRGTRREQLAWGYWERWISEIVADFWSVGKLGISSTLGLMGVVSLPAWFVFRANEDDPHPMPWVRVKLSCAVGEAIFRHPQWRELSAIWDALYPPTSPDAERRALIAALEDTMPAFVDLLVGHRPASLHGRSLLEIMPVAERHPALLAARYRRWRRARRELREAPPTLALAVLGQARYLGALEPEAEGRLVGSLLTYWALRSTFTTSASSAAPTTPTIRDGRTVARGLRRATVAEDEGESRCRQHELLNTPKPPNRSSSSTHRRSSRAGSSGSRRRTSRRRRPTRPSVRRTGSTGASPIRIGRRTSDGSTSTTRSRGSRTGTRPRRTSDRRT